jgi:hypothetical protein
MESKPGGTLIRGADGHLYFMQRDAYQASRVSPEDEARINQQLDRFQLRDVPFFRADIGQELEEFFLGIFGCVFCHIVYSTTDKGRFGPGQ